MKVLLYSINYSPELTGIGKYNGELAADFASKGIDSYIVTAPPYYPEWEVHNNQRGQTRLIISICFLY